MPEDVVSLSYKTINDFLRAEFHNFTSPSYEDFCLPDQTMAEIFGAVASGMGIAGVAADNPQTGCSQQLLVNDNRRVRKISKSSRLIPVLSFSLSIPHWLAQSSLQISVCRESRNWTLSLKPYRTVPHNLELAEAIKHGDFDKFRYLIESKQATVLDRDGFGRTILHV